MQKQFCSLCQVALTKGFALYMMQQEISTKKRRLAAEHAGYQARFIMDILKDTEQAKTLSHISNSFSCESYQSA